MGKPSPQNRLKKRYSNPNVSAMPMVEQNALFQKMQRRNNNAHPAPEQQQQQQYNPISIRLNTYLNEQNIVQNQQQYHRKNNNAVQPISVNSSMMNTIRENMQHHLSPTSDDDEWAGNRKSTLV